MRKSARELVAVCCCAVLLAALFVLSGCGSGRNSTQQVLDKADRFVNSVDSNVDRLSTDVKALARSIKEGTEITREMLSETYASTKGQAQKVVDSVRSAQAEIKKIVADSGAGGIDRYLDIQNEMLDNAVTLTNTLSDLFGQLSSAAKAMASGGAPDASGLSRTAEEWISSFDRIEENSRALVEKASKLKDEGGP